MNPFLWAMAILFGLGLVAFLWVIPQGYRIDRNLTVDPPPKPSSRWTLRHRKRRKD
ncbi:MAG: hypothetical protein K6U87_16795 [Firmicutes bacterium]|nr:hypothetical protein [Bacillota bacterium]